MKLHVSVLFCFASLLAPVFETAQERSQDSCKLTPQGTEYRGTAQTTKSGLVCQRWDTQVPHSHSRTRQNYPHSGLDNNFCRNPDGEPEPWCYTLSSSRRWETCNIEFCERVECKRNQLGLEYRGRVAKTMSGLTCQRWGSQSPHSHDNSPIQKQHAGLWGNNFCRNPDGEPKPWCYTTSSSKRWEFCDIPICLPEHLTASQCERDWLQISCYSGAVIRILDANYGGPAQSWCSPPPLASASCVYENSASIVKAECEDKHHCVVTVNNDKFRDECIGKTKSLTVNYYCEFIDVQSLYMGCYVDDEVRALPDRKSDLNKNMHVGLIEHCIAYCRSKSQPYAGLQYYDECFCGTDYARHGKAEESSCSTKCRDWTGRACGGNWRNSIYMTRSLIKDIENADLSSFGITSACSFQRDGNVYKLSSGSCNMQVAIRNMIPMADFDSVAGDLSSADNFLVNQIRLRNDGTKKFIYFDTTSVGSVELVPRRLMFPAGAQMTLGWRYDDYLPKNATISFKGRISFGDNNEVLVKISKSSPGPDYDMELTMASLNIEQFLRKFDIDPEEMTESELSEVKQALGLATLTMQNPTVKGVFEVGGGFEIIAQGNVAAPQLLSDAASIYLVVQDFKAADGTSFAKPVAAILAFYNYGFGPADAILALTGNEVPRITVSNVYNRIAITAASREIYNINTEELRKVAENFIPEGGFSIIKKGVSIISYFFNIYFPDIKNNKDEIAKKLLFHCKIKEDVATWTSPMLINAPISNFLRFDFFFTRFLVNEKMKIPLTKKGKFVSFEIGTKIKYKRVTFNLTEIVPVFEDGLVALTSSTISLTSNFSGGAYQHYQVTGKGQEVILDELVDVTVTQEENGTYVRADSSIFDLSVVRNRTKSWVLYWWRLPYFTLMKNLPLVDLHYEVSFERNKVLRFKGFAMVDGRPAVEILYYIANEVHRLKVGLHFQDKLIHDVVNMLHGKEIISTTWLNFANIGLVFKHYEFSTAEYQVEKHLFHNDILQKTDRDFSDILVYADTLNLQSCHNTGWKMCDFFYLHFGETIDVTFTGTLSNNGINMQAKLEFLNLDLGTDVTFGFFTVMKLMSPNGAASLTFDGLIGFTNTQEYFPGSIFDDGTNKLMLMFNSTGNYYLSAFPELVRKFRPEGSTRILGPLNFVKLRPIHAKWEIPSSEKLTRIDLRSTLHVGSVRESAIEFIASKSRQYIHANQGEPIYQFVGEKNGVIRLDTIFAAFDAPNNDVLLQDAEFESVIVGYTSTDETWKPKEYDVKVTKGLRFFGQLKLKSKETYKTTVVVNENLQIETRLQMPPLKYGKTTTKEDGTISQAVNLLLYLSADRPERGPTLVIGNQFRRFEGYGKTLGIAGQFRSEVEERSNLKYYVFKINGTLYNEVQQAEVILKTVVKERPEEFNFKYRVDLTKQVRQQANSSVQEALSDFKMQASKGKTKASELVAETQRLLDRYKAEETSHRDEMLRVRNKIQKIDSHIDASVMDISTNCIDKCRTVSMPGLEWQQNCIDVQGQNDMKCLTWNEDSEKVVNVMCLVQCEAKKISAVATASQNLREIRILVNRYKESQMMANNVAKMVQLTEDALNIAKETRTLVEDKAVVETKIDSLLNRSSTADLVEIKFVHVHSDLTNIISPCLKFHMVFKFNTVPPIRRTRYLHICFNGEFFKNVAVVMLKSAFPGIDALYKALEEAELRFIQIETIKKSLNRVADDMTKEKSSKRSDIEFMQSDIVDKYLLNKAERRIPGFTTKSDLTVMAFTHYSPWAVTRRSQPLRTVPQPLHQKYNFSSLQGESHCQQTRSIVSAYRDIANGIDTISKHYQRGKKIFGKSKISVKRDVLKSRNEILQMINATKLREAEKRDMMFWHSFTKEGMNEYLNTIYSRLSKHNTMGMSFYRNELSSFYGKQDFFDALHEVGHNAYKRSNIRASAKEQHIADFGQTGKQLQHLLFGKEVTLEETTASMVKLHGKIDTLYRSAVSCY